MNLMLHTLSKQGGLKMRIVVCPGSCDWSEKFSKSNVPSVHATTVLDGSVLTGCSRGGGTFFRCFVNKFLWLNGFFSCSDKRARVSNSRLSNVRLCSKSFHWAHKTFRHGSFIYSQLHDIRLSWDTHSPKCRTFMCLRLAGGTSLAFCLPRFQTMKSEFYD